MKRKTRTMAGVALVLGAILTTVARFAFAAETPLNYHKWEWRFPDGGGRCWNTSCGSYPPNPFCCLIG
jgi:hypothetical protein